MEDFSDTIGNRTRDLPAGRALPQPSALQSACEVPVQTLAQVVTAFVSISRELDLPCYSRVATPLHATQGELLAASAGSPRINK
jgi:hypothetical protein